MGKMKSEKNYLVLSQYREGSEYNDFLGKYYHFPKKYLNLLSTPNIEFVYYEPKKGGKGEYYGFGKITKKPFPDKREEGAYFVEISDFKPFSQPVPFDDGTGPREVPPYYNPQDAVRRLSKETLDEICLDGGIQLNFKPDVHLIKVLGEQLIASEKVGILELIKNAYDAQATYCRVRIEKVDSLREIDESLYEFNKYEGPVIVIEDDGVGMTKEVIEKGWLRPASTLKTNVKERLKKEKQKAIESGSLGTYEALVKQLKKEYKNRIPLGEKGVGRFATHRLGKHLIIKTKVKELDYEYLLKIDWALFDSVSTEAVDLESIGVSLTRCDISREYGETNSGTQVIIYGGKEGFDWDQKTIEDLNQSILRLNSPNPSPKEKKGTFKAILECPQIPNLLDCLIIEDYKPIFSFDGLVDDEGILDYKLEFNPPQLAVPMQRDTIEDNCFDIKKSEKSKWKNSSNGKFRIPKCGVFFIHLDIWYRTSPWIDGPDRNQLTEYLDNFGGISIYRDGINIFPAEWGSEIDWLNLTTRHIKKGSNISYYNMIGNIELDQTDNIDLIDKTDRQGLIKNEAYSDFVNLVEAIIKIIVEREFRGKRKQYSDMTKDIVRDPKTLRDYVKQNVKIVSNIKEKYPIKDDPHELLEELGDASQRKAKLINLERSIKNLQDSLKLIDEQRELLTEQAAFGLAIAVSIHEIAKITSNFYYGINESLKKQNIDKEKLTELLASSSSLNSELKRLSPLRAVRNEKKIKFNILRAIQYTYEIKENELKKTGIKVLIDKNSDFDVYARYRTLIQVFSNLFDNSLYWLDTLDKFDEKTIRIKLDPLHRLVIFADNGPGIHKAIFPYLFQAGYSMKIPPSGLGLYICKYYLQSMKGDIHLTTSKDRVTDLNGAQFTLNFGSVPEDKEEAK
ncbi:MAG: ATP-binding protein [Candidatus Aminicenantes bacterium]|nr:ATP-binding protein [Candidatus Aminicenantes bacterium]